MDNAKNLEANSLILSAGGVVGSAVRANFDTLKLIGVGIGAVMSLGYAGGLNAQTFANAALQMKQHPSYQDLTQASADFDTHNQAFYKNLAELPGVSTIVGASQKTGAILTASLEAARDKMAADPSRAAMTQAPSALGQDATKMAGSLVKTVVGAFQIDLSVAGQALTLANASLAQAQVGNLFSAEGAKAISQAMKDHSSRKDMHDGAHHMFAALDSFGQATTDMAKTTLKAEVAIPTQLAVGLNTVASQNYKAMKAELPSQKTLAELPVVSSIVGAFQKTSAASLKTGAVLNASFEAAREKMAADPSRAAMTQAPSALGQDATKMVRSVGKIGLSVLETDLSMAGQVLTLANASLAQAQVGNLFSAEGFKAVSEAMKNHPSRKDMHVGANHMSAAGASLGNAATNMAKTLFKAEVGIPTQLAVGFNTIASKNVEAMKAELPSLAKIDLGHWRSTRSADQSSPSTAPAAKAKGLNM